MNALTRQRTGHSHPSDAIVTLTRRDLLTGMTSVVTLGPQGMVWHSGVGSLSSVPLCGTYPLLPPFRFNIGCCDPRSQLNHPCCVIPAEETLWCGLTGMTSMVTLGTQGVVWHSSSCDSGRGCLTGAIWGDRGQTGQRLVTIGTQGV